MQIPFFKRTKEIPVGSTQKSSHQNKRNPQQPKPAQESRDTPTALALTANGDVVVTGSTNTGGDFGELYDFYTAKYASADGALLWQNQYDGPGHFRDIPNAVAVDSGGNVIVTGYTSVSNSNVPFAAAYLAV